MPHCPAPNRLTAFALALLLTGSGSAARAATAWTEPLAEGLRLVPLPDGCHVIGSPPAEPFRKRGERQQTLCIAGLWMAATEITNRQYRQFRPEHNSGRHRQWSLDGDDQPVTGISQLDARAYAAWLSERTGRRYRLPGNGEWEVAARAGDDGARPWGDDAVLACRTANVLDRHAVAADPRLDWPAHPCDDGHVVAAPVGTLPANRWGLHDMLGNVWEWSCTPVDAESGETASECGDPQEGDAPRVVVRGGSWANGPGEVRSAAQLALQPDLRFRTVGFRLLLEDLSRQ